MIDKRKLKHENKKEKKNKILGSHDLHISRDTVNRLTRNVNVFKYSSVLFFFNVEVSVL